MTEPPAMDSGETKPAVADSPPSGAAHEGRIDRVGRHVQRARVYGSAGLLVAMIVVLVALIVANTRQVKISWVFGSSHSSLIWIIVVSALVGWTVGLVTGYLLRRRSRRSL